MASASANHDKHQVALNSVAAGVALTAFKIVVALTTGSLALLAESAHSALDLISAFTTFLAVKISGRPADTTHHYGHGKVENLSALFEMVLLIATCTAIIYEAIQRLLFTPVDVDASVWAFIVMVVSIFIDFSRSRALDAAARKYNSQALEADALNYRNDMYSSVITIVGLLLVRLSHVSPSLGFLQHADSVAALGLALIIIRVGGRLGVQAVGGLLDRAPNISVEQIEQAVQAIPGVVDAHQIRLRASGPDFFVDLHVTMNPKMPLDEVHELMDHIEAVVRQIVPGADVDVHPEPAE